MSTIGVAIPSIPPRADLLERALASVIAQTRQADHINITVDTDKQGATATRNRSWRALGPVDYIAFLDDDDEMLPDHLRRLMDVAQDTQADFVFSWFTVVGGSDPFPESFFTDAWDSETPRQTTITGLWRREALECIGGFATTADGRDELGNRIGEDYLAVLQLNSMGGKIVHLPERTWLWHHDTPGGNTSGLPTRW